MGKQWNYMARAQSRIVAGGLGSWLGKGPASGTMAYAIAGNASDKLFPTNEDIVERQYAQKNTGNALTPFSTEEIKNNYTPYETVSNRSLNKTFDAHMAGSDMANSVMSIISRGSANQGIFGKNTASNQSTGMDMSLSKMDSKKFGGLPETLKERGSVNDSFKSPSVFNSMVDKLNSNVSKLWNKTGGLFQGGSTPNNKAPQTQVGEASYPDENLSTYDSTNEYFNPPTYDARKSRNDIFDSQDLLDLQENKFRIEGMKGVDSNLPFYKQYDSSVSTKPFSFNVNSFSSFNQ